METSAYYPFGLPLYVMLVAVELWLARRRGLPTLSFAASVSNVTSGVGSIVMGLVLGPMWLALYAWGSETFALVHFRAGSWVPYVLALVLADLAHYWNHRMDHRVAACWAIHGVHHQSEEMNFTTGMRHGWFSDFFSIPFYAPLTLLGIELRHFFFATVILSLHALLTHSAVVRFPSFGILVTPQSHSLHHARNAPYADRNFAVMFSVWDRLFGTHVELDPRVPPIYGTTRGYPTHDGVRAQWVLWADLFARARQVRGVAAKARIFVGRPSEDGLAPQARAPASKDIALRTKLGVAALLVVTCGASLFVFLGRDGIPFSMQLVCGAGILVVMSTLCGVLDGRYRSTRPATRHSPPGTSDDCSSPRSASSRRSSPCRRLRRTPSPRSRAGTPDTARRCSSLRS